MVVNALWTDPVNTGVTFGIILAGIPVYYAWRSWSGGALGGAVEEARETPGSRATLSDARGACFRAFPLRFAQGDSQQSLCGRPLQDTRGTKGSVDRPASSLIPRRSRHRSRDFGVPSIPTNLSQRSLPTRNERRPNRLGVLRVLRVFVVNRAAISPLLRNYGAIRTSIARSAARTLCVSAPIDT